jgi:type IV secretion system protein VirD4
MQLKEFFGLPFKAIGTVGTLLLKGYVLNSKTGAKFAKPKDYKDYLSSSNTGLLLDGQSLRLSERDSFQNMCVIARVGAGKTSRYIIPNVLARGRENVSLVVNDPKGEVFAATSGYMKACGFDIKVIDLEHPERSSCFNPLLEARNDIELEQIAEIVIHAGNPGSKDPFWNHGATRILSVLLKCLQNAGRNDPNIFTLANINYLFQNFGPDGSNLADFIGRASVLPNDPTDMRLFNEWLGATTGNREGVQSFVLNAVTALRSFTNQNVARLTSRSDFQLTDMRKRKTIIYFITPPQLAEYYSPITSIFFRCVFNACMREAPDRKTLPVYILYDEFGHSTIPNFVSTANTIRAYKVSLSVVLQSISQLAARYGKDQAAAIQGGFTAYLTYAGADPETAQFFERVAGKVRERQRHDLDEPHRASQMDYNLMNADEVRRIPESQTLIVSGNRQPVLLEAKPYFEVSEFNRRSKQSPYLPSNTALPAIKYVNL